MSREVEQAVDTARRDIEDFVLLLRNAGSDANALLEDIVYIWPDRRGRQFCGQKLQPEADLLETMLRSLRRQIEAIGGAQEHTAAAEDSRLSALQSLESVQSAIREAERWAYQAEDGIARVRQDSERTAQDLDAIREENDRLDKDPGW